MHASSARSLSSAERGGSSSSSSIGGVVSGSGSGGRPPVSNARLWGLHANICGALTQLARNDLNATLIREGNGVYLLASLLPALASPESGGDGSGLIEKETAAAAKRQCHAFRALRWIHSVERNRRLFRTLFKPSLMELFLRVPHYSWKVDHYTPLVAHVNALHALHTAAFKRRILETNIEREPTTEIKDELNKVHTGR